MVQLVDDSDKTTTRGRSSQLTLRGSAPASITIAPSTLVVVCAAHTGQEPIQRFGVAMNARLAMDPVSFVSFIRAPAFLVFGIPLIDEVYRYRARRGRVK
jgi:hypothetical protein